MRLSISTILLIFLFSCSTTSELKLEFEEDIVIDLSKVSENNLSSIFDSTRYILLEEDDQVPLVNFFKTIVTDKYVYVQDNNLHNIFKFDHLGRISSIIKSTGAGPTEFTQIEDYQVINDTVIIRDNLLRKQIYLTDQGKFIRQYSSKNNASNFYQGSDFNLFFLNGLGGVINKEFLRVSDSGAEEGFLDIDQNNPIIKVKLLHGFVQNERTKQLSITLPHSYEVAFFDSSGLFDRKINFDFLNIPITQVQEKKYLQAKIVNAFFPFENFYYMNVFFQLTGYQIILNKNFEPTYIGKNLKNDLDGMSFYILPVAYYKDFAILYLHSTYIHNTYKHFEADIKENYPDAPIHQFIKDHESELTNDRHVLVYLRFKDSFYRKN
jgi:hypothetical protein